MWWTRASALAVWLIVPPCSLAAEVSFKAPLAGGRFNSTVESLLERRWKHVTRQQLDFSCGSAALATLLNYHLDRQVSEGDLIQAIIQTIDAEQVRKRGGFSLLDLKRVAVALGYKVEGYKLTLEKLKGLATPALVPLSIRNYKHFVVFRGAADDRVVLADPSFGNIVLPQFEFEQDWQGVALVVVEDGKERKPSQLDVLDEDVPLLRPEDTLPPLLYRIRVHAVRGADEF